MKFSKISWEQIFQYVQNQPESSENEIMINYFQNKTVGYNSNGKLTKAFQTL
jgi:hypothetical protein